MAECIKYISRQDTLDYIENEYCMDCEHSDGVLCKDCHYKDCMDIIRAMPAADVQSVKHGKWIDIHEWCKMHNCKPSGIGFYYWCSNCGKCVNHRSNYCDECGARNGQ